MRPSRVPQIIASTSNALSSLPSSSFLISPPPSSFSTSQLSSSFPPCSSFQSPDCVSTFFSGVRVDAHEPFLLMLYVLFFLPPPPLRCSLPPAERDRRLRRRRVPGLPERERGVQAADQGDRPAQEPELRHLLQQLEQALRPRHHPSGHAYLLQLQGKGNTPPQDLKENLQENTLILLGLEWDLGIFLQHAQCSHSRADLGEEVMKSGFFFATDLQGHPAPPEPPPPLHEPGHHQPPGQEEAGGQPGQCARGSDGGLQELPSSRTTLEIACLMRRAKETSNRGIGKGGEGQNWAVLFPSLSRCCFLFPD